MIYVNKTTGQMIRLVDFIEADEALVFDIKTDATFSITRKSLSNDYIKVDLNNNRIGVCGCYKNKC